MIFVATVVGSHAEEIAHKVVIKKIETEIQQTPRFQVDGVKDKKSDPRYWFEIEAELEVQSTDTTGRIDPAGFIPEITANWFVIIKEKQSGKTKMLTGKATFRDIRTKDKTIHISAYISPDVLEKLTGDNKVSVGDIEAVALVVSGAGIITKDPYAAGLQKATAAEEAKWWLTDKYQTIEGVVVAKSKTPFASLWTDRYPIEKTE